MVGQVIVSFEYKKQIKKMADYFPCLSLIETEQVRSAFSIDGPEKTSIIVYAPIMLLLSIFNLAVLIGVKAFRQPPSDILILTNAFAATKIIDIFVTMIYDDINPTEQYPSNYSSFCTGTAFMDTLAEIAKAVYTLFFCIYYTRKVRNPLKAWSGHNKELHLVCGLVIIATTFGLYFGRILGPTPYGYCGMKFTTSSAYVSSCISFIYTAILIIASIAFLKYIRKIQNQNQQAKSYLKYYFFFLFIFCSNQLILASSTTAVSYACVNQTNQTMFNGARVTATVSTLTTPLFILIIVLSNEKNRKITVVELFRRIANKYKKWRIKKKNQKARQSTRTSFLDDLNQHRHSNNIVLQMIDQPLNDSYLGELRNQNRACLLTTLLGCISIHHFQLKNYVDLGLQVRTSAVEEDRQGLFLWNYAQKSQFSLTQTLKRHYHNLFIQKIVTIKMDFTAYAPTVLNQFVHMDRIKNIGESLSPLKNYQEIINDCKNNEGEGGRSGQFFFFSKDRTFILKTISSKERQVFTDRIKVFHEHFRSHPNSLIVKLYSVFTVNARDLEQQYDFTLMGNILGKIDKKYVLRTYDLKGSTHSRQVMKNQEISPQISKTMKDVDFQRLEGQVWVSQQDRQHLLQSIEADSAFFRDNGLIDYSLIIIKIDYRKLIQENQGRNFLDNLVYYNNVKEEGQIYFFGIIDYLQTWNIRKKGQKWYKSIMNKSEGISSQDPIFYSQRFIQFGSKIFQRVTVPSNESKK